MPTWAVAVIYAACVAGAVLLARAWVLPTVPLSQTLVFAFVVWLGGVTFTALWQAADRRW